MNFSRLLLLCPFLLPLPSSAGAKELTGVYEPTAGPCPTVEEAIAKMTVPDGYEVRCFASEPMIINPVAMTWDHRGRLWVVELYEYPSGAKQPNEYSKTATDEKFRPVVKPDASSPRDRVVVLEDTDNDGKADKRTVFAEGLNLATAILCGYDGVFVGQAPNMLYFRDTDGDDKADEYKTVLTGFGLEDRHELLNSFMWGPDGYMYFTHGVFTHSKVRRPGEKEDLGNTLTAGIYRVKFTAGESVRDGVPSPGTVPDGPFFGGVPFSSPTVAFHEVYADGTSNPWGVDFDARGNAFVEACVIDHLFHMAPGGIYARQGGAPENPYAYELLPSIVQPDQPKHFRAAYAGIQIYQGGVYPKDTEGHAFFGNIHDNSIHEEALDPSGATFKARPIRDFLRANNGWFRPVSIQTGPDGFLWVMDWCDKYPCYQNAQANPEGVDREKGRIWRVCYMGSEEGKKLAGMSREEKEMNISGDSPEVLVPHLRNPNSWVRRKAAMQWIEKANRVITKPASFPILPGEKQPMIMVRQYADERGIWLRDLQSELDAGHPFAFEIHSILLASNNYAQKTAFKSPDAAVRTLAARLEGDLHGGNPSTGYKSGKGKEGELLLNVVLEILASDPEPTVRAAVAIALRSASETCLTVDSAKNDEVQLDYDPPQIPYKWKLGGLPPDILSNLVTTSASADYALAFHIWMGIEPHLAVNPGRYLPWLADLAPKTKPLSEILTYKSARRVTDTRSAENMDLLLGFLDKIKDDDALTARALDGMLKAQEAGALKPATVDPAALFAHWEKSGSEQVRNFAGRLATLWGDPKAVAALMGTALDNKADLTQRIEAIRTVRRLKSDAARAGIRKLLGEKSPDALTVEVLRAAGELGGLDLANDVLKAWQGYPGVLKTAAAEVMTTREDWANRLLDAVEGKWIASGKISASDIPVSVRRSLAQNDKLKARAQELLGAWNESGDDIKALIAAKKKAALAGEPDMANGKAIFTSICAVCHKFHGGGQEVGPDLIGSGRSNLDALLANVIDPNQIIGNGYENVIVTTADGRAVAGRVLEDTPTQMTLLGIGGVKTVVPRGEIQKADNTHQSLMPMGFGSLPDADFRDLVWYLLAPPDEGPLTPEKKESFTRSIDAPGVSTAPPPPSDGTDLWKPERRDRESASLWNPDWTLDAPDFEGTPTKLVTFHGQKNVLVLHPQSRTAASALVRTLTLPADKPATLSVRVASHDGGDWDLVATCNGKALPGGGRVHHDEPDQRWRKVSWDLSAWQGKEVTLRLENRASDWMNEFSFWSDLRLETK